MTEPARVIVVEQRVGPGSTVRPWAAFMAACEAGDWETVSRINAELAGEFPVVDRIMGWCLEAINESWPDSVEEAREVWAGAIAEERAGLLALGERLTNAQPKPQVEPKAEPEEEEDQEEPRPGAKPKAKPYTARVFRPAPLPPEGASELERLTYPRGLLGHAVQYIIDTAQLPDRWMALAGALSALGKCLDRKVLGPLDNSVVLFILILAESGAGKNHILNCIKTILEAVSLSDCFIGTGIASVQSIEQVLEGMSGDEGQPSVLVEIDEYGSFLSRISSKGQTGNVSEIPATLCILWGWSPQAMWKGSIKMNKKMVEVYGPAFSMFGASTEPLFYRALKTRQITGGFVSRHLIINAGRGAERRVKPHYNWASMPVWLRQALREVAGKEAPPCNRPMINGMHVLWDWRRIGWADDEVAEFHNEYEYQIRKRASGDERDIWIRAPEMALRLATIVAMFRGSTVVDMVDLRWGIAVAEQSVTKIVEGVEANMVEDFELVEVIRLLRAKLEELGTKPMTRSVLFRICENKVKDQRTIWAAINHLVTVGDAVEVEPSGTGRPTDGKWKWNGKPRRWQH